MTAFNIRVPLFIKRSLTTMQITQFVVGASCAMVHSFINYTIPVVASSQTDAAPSSASAAASGSTAGASSFKDTLARQTMPCITSSGETFAVWLNVFYLAPLTYLFVSFFVESYLRRSNTGRRGAAAGTGVAARRLSNNVQLAEKAGWDAARGVRREVYGEGNQEAVVEGGRKKGIRRG